MNKRDNLFKGALGYTLDQTILIVAIIAILITLVVVTVGLDLINRSNGTKLAAHLRQVEDSMQLFYGRFGQWPDDALTASGGTSNATNHIVVLQRNIFGATSAPRYQDKHTNNLAGFEGSASGVLHSFGGTGLITASRMAGDAVSDLDDSIYWVIKFDDVPMDEAMEADEAVDPDPDIAGGRLVLVADGNDCDGAQPASTDNTADVCYVANLI